MRRRTSRGPVSELVELYERLSPAARRAVWALLALELVLIAVARTCVAAAAFATGWVLRDAQARGLPRREALTWAALQWVEFPLFLWLYRRIRPKHKSERCSTCRFR